MWKCLDKRGTTILQATTSVYMLLHGILPNVLICKSKIIDTAMKISTVLERGHLQQSIEVIR